MTDCAPCAEEGSHRHGSEGDDDSQVLQEHHLSLQVRLAPSELDPRRLVLRWSAPHRGRNVAIPKDESVVFRDRRWPVRETRAVQSATQPTAAPSSGEWTARGDAY